MAAEIADLGQARTRIANRPELDRGRKQGRHADYGESAVEAQQRKPRQNSQKNKLSDVTYAVTENGPVMLNPGKQRRAHSLLRLPGNQGKGDRQNEIGSMQKDSGDHSRQG